MAIKMANRRRGSLVVSRSSTYPPGGVKHLSGGDHQVVVRGRGPQEDAGEGPPGVRWPRQRPFSTGQVRIARYQRERQGVDKVTGRTCQWSVPGNQTLTPLNVLSQKTDGLVYGNTGSTKRTGTFQSQVSQSRHTWYGLDKRSDQRIQRTVYQSTVERVYDRHSFPSSITNQNYSGKGKDTNVSNPAVSTTTSVIIKNEELICVSKSDCVKRKDQHDQVAQCGPHKGNILKSSENTLVKKTNPPYPANQTSSAKKNVRRKLFDDAPNHSGGITAQRVTNPDYGKLPGRTKQVENSKEFYPLKGNAIANSENRTPHVVRPERGVQGLTTGGVSPGNNKETTRARVLEHFNETFDPGVPKYRHVAGEKVGRSQLYHIASRRQVPRQEAPWRRSDRWASTGHNGRGGPPWRKGPLVESLLERRLSKEQLRVLKLRRALATSLVSIIHRCLNYCNKSFISGFSQCGWIEVYV